MTKLTKTIGYFVTDLFLILFTLVELLVSRTMYTKLALLFPSRTDIYTAIDRVTHSAVAIHAICNRRPGVTRLRRKYVC